jgi:hypothetical protein
LTNSDKRGIIDKLSPLRREERRRYYVGEPLEALKIFLKKFEKRY